MSAFWKAALAAPFLASAQAPADRPIWVNYPAVEQVQCDLGMGSAVRIADGSFVTANHVSANELCTVEGKGIHVTSHSGELDFATFTIEGKPRKGLEIDCSGIHPGQWVFAVGYARGWPRQQLIPLYGTPWHHENGWAILLGRVIQGQSGGAIFTAKGELVGIVNANNDDFNISFVREMKDTPLCAGR